MRVLFIAEGNEKWLGGVYYIRNIIFQLLQCRRESLDVYVYVDKKIAYIYDELKEYKNVHILVAKEERKVTKFEKVLFGRALTRDIIYLTYRYQINAIFPYHGEGILYDSLLASKCIAWIPDFQHVHYPQYFTKNILAQRDAQFEDKAKRHYKMVLSSQDAYNDYKTLYPGLDKGVYVVPFVSYLEKDLVFADEIESVKGKYNISGNYFMICNQFWMHKNHLVAFEAIKQMKNSDAVLVCTGKLEDHRNKRYSSEIKRYIEENNLRDRIKLLGILDKKEQVQLMKGAVAIVQPSLFEGWGTCVEDAKTLGKRTVLSDIDVHYEQADGQSVFFPRNDSIKLAEVLDSLWIEYKNKAPEWKYQIRCAKKYGKLFYKMLMDKR